VMMMMMIMIMKIIIIIIIIIIIGEAFLYVMTAYKGSTVLHL
jgi:hypothetical protein